MVSSILIGVTQLDITDDNFLSLMSDDGSLKDDVKVPDGDVGDKIKKLFTDDGKDTSKINQLSCRLNTC